MERDFLGLKWKESSSKTLKQIITTNGTDTVNDSVSGMQRWWSEYASGSSEFQPFKATTQDSTLTSQVYANVDYNHNHDHNTLPNKVKSLYRPWKFLFQDETVPISSNNHQFPGGFPFAEWPSSSTLSPIDPRNKSKQILEAAPPPEGRLTIIYDNDVYVFEDISPDKAEAIMRLAKEKSYSSCFTDEDDTKQVEEQSTLMDNSTMAISFPANTPPLARKATLEHFMQKRKDRLTQKEMFYDFMNTSSSSNEEVYSEKKINN